MINSADLNRRVVGRESGNSGEFTPITAGNYDVVVHEIKEWKNLIRDSYVNVTDADGKLERDANGKVVKELVKDLSFYTADVVLKIVGGDFANRRLYPSLTTHPSAVFITENFLYAVGEESMTFGEIAATKDKPSKLAGRTLTVSVVEDSYVKKITDPDTGFEKSITKPKASVKSYIRPSHLIEIEEIEV